MGIWGANGMFRAKIKGTISATNDTCWRIAKFGGRTIATTSPASFTNNTANWFMEVEVRNQNNVSSQYATLEDLQPFSSGGSKPEHQASSTALTLNTANDQDLTLEADCGDGSDTVTFEVMDIQIYK